mgnify:CR=1 FL=1
MDCENRRQHRIDDAEAVVIPWRRRPKSTFPRRQSRHVVTIRLNGYRRSALSPRKTPGILSVAALKLLLLEGSRDRPGGPYKSRVPLSYRNEAAVPAGDLAKIGSNPARDRTPGRIVRARMERPIPPNRCVRGLCCAKPGRCPAPSLRPARQSRTQGPGPLGTADRNEARHRLIGGAQPADGVHQGLIVARRHRPQIEQ